MQTFLAILFHCALALGLGLVPVANAFDMAAMAAPQEDVPPCHAPSQDHQKPDGNCCGGIAHCHCAMATALPVARSIIAHPFMPSDHPQTVRPLTLQRPVVPDTPPPRA